MGDMEDNRVVLEDRQRVVKWLDLPTELWIEIAKHVTIDNNTTLDILRFRSVCKPWRSALPLPHPHRTPFAPRVCIRFGYECLRQIKIYRLEPSSHENPSITSSKKGWIITLGESESVPLRLLNPFTHNTPKMFPPKLLNLINFRAVELIEAFTLGDPCSYIRVCKVVLFPSFSVKGGIVCVLFDIGALCVSKIGDEKWSIVGVYRPDYYHDIILHKGRVFVIDNLGAIFWMNPSSLELVDFSQSLCQRCCGNRKQMVESRGSLYVIDRYIQGSSHREQVDIEVCKLDEECGRWVNVKNLGDVAFVLGEDFNFSLSAQDYYGCQGNCIYFSHEHRIFCYNLEDSKLIESPKPFWPCPTLFSPKFNL